jgi:hypothetical protein
MGKKIRHTKKDTNILNKQKQVFKEKTGKEIGYDYNFPMPIVLEKIMDEIVGQSTKAGIDSYYLLRHFQFTDEEIEEYFDRLGKDITTRVSKAKLFFPL